MITEVTMYSGSCDNCKTEYYDEHNGWAAMNDENSIWELMDSDGWHNEDGKHYCPDCFYFDNEDNFIIKSQINMKQSIFKKEVSATGSQGTIKAEIIATMNYTSKIITGTHAYTHDDYSRNIPVHKVEVFINGKVWEKELDLTSEIMLYNESERLIELAKKHCDDLANSKPIKTFGEKMIELFS